MRGFISQHKPIPKIGGGKELVIRTAVYLSVINFALIAPTAYAVLKPSIVDIVPWMSFGVFMGILVGLVLVIMFLEYKFMMPSHIAFLSGQKYKHENPFREDLEEANERLKRIEKKLGIEEEK